MTLTKNTFIGEYSYSLDSKGRINMPAKFRQALSKDNKNTFVTTRGMDACIWVYSLNQWLEIWKQSRLFKSVMMKYDQWTLGDELIIVDPDFS